MKCSMYLTYCIHVLSFVHEISNSISEFPSKMTFFYLSVLKQYAFYFKNLANHFHCLQLQAHLAQHMKQPLLSFWTDADLDQTADLDAQSDQGLHCIHSKLIIFRNFSPVTVMYDQFVQISV